MAQGRKIAEQLLHAAARVDSDRTAARLKAELDSVQQRYAAALQTIEGLEKRLSLVDALDTRGKGKAGRPLAAVSKGTASAILVLSDWHVEETVRPEVVNGLNAYNLEIATASVTQCFDKALLLLRESRHLATIDEMVVAVLGDLISGYIHEELQEDNAMAPLPATMFAASLLEDGLRRLLKYGNLKRIVVPCCHGNHGRTTKKPRISTSAANSYEHNLYLHLAKRFSDEPRIHFQVADGYHTWVNIQGYDVRFHHGDAINYWGGVGGITIPVNKAIGQWQKSRRADYDFFGHFHTFLWHNRWVCNGSVIGYGPYSLRIKADFEVPQQAFAVIDRARGLTRVLPVFCRPAAKQAAK